MSREFKSAIMLLVSAVIWGFSYVAQSKGMQSVGPFTFNTSRSIIACIFLLLTFVIFKKTSNYYKNEVFSWKKTIIYGLICGILMTIATNLQQIGIVGTTTGKAGFLTATYIVIIPIFELFLGKKIKKRIIVCIFFAMIGTYLLSVKENLAINRWDLLILVAAIFFALHIMVMSRMPSDCQAILTSFMQFFVVMIVSLVLVLLKETITFEGLKKAFVAILFVGILSSGVGFTLQLIAIKDIDPTIGSLISSLESVFAAIGGWLVLGQGMDIREISGCVIILISTIVAQIPSKRGIKIEEIEN